MEAEQRGRAERQSQRDSFTVALKGRLAVLMESASARFVLDSVSAFAYLNSSFDGLVLKCFRDHEAL